MNAVSPFFFENLLNGQMVIYLDTKYHYMALVEVTEFCSDVDLLIPVKIRLVITGTHPSGNLQGTSLLIHRKHLLDPLSVAAD